MKDNFWIIAQNLRFLREKKGYTQELLAEKVGLSASHISKVESGQRHVGMKTYLNILSALDAKPEEYVLCTLDTMKKSGEEQMRELLEDCTEEERMFLLDMLKDLKENMRKFRPV